MVSITDMELCVLALSQTYSIKKMQKLLPRNVKSRFKWKNNIYINKNVRKVQEDLAKRGMLHNEEFQNAIMGIFHPEQIYVLSKEDQIILQIRESGYGKYIFEEIGEGEFQISKIEDAEKLLNSYIDFDKRCFSENVLYHSSLEVLKKTQKRFIKQKKVESELTEMCEISSRLEKPMWTLERHKHTGTGKNVDVIVWNRDTTSIEFCYTANNVQGCEISIGKIRISR